MHALAAALFLALAVLVSDAALARAPYGKVQGGGSGPFGKAQGGTQPGRPPSHSGHHHHGSSFVGVGFGFAYPWYWYYPPPYYYPGYYHPHPVTYIEQGAAAEEPGGWWYYCESSTSYYPYANECPDGWVRVPAEPPPN
jgi:hypothetical protein